jgi:hypothetical protein
LPIDPAQLLQNLLKRCKPGLTFRTLRSPVHEHANPARTFRLLRVDRERQCDRPRTNKGYEIATPHGTSAGAADYHAGRLRKLVVGRSDREKISVLSERSAWAVLATLTR